MGTSRSVVDLPHYWRGHIASSLDGQLASVELGGAARTEAKIPATSSKNEKE